MTRLSSKVRNQVLKSHAFQCCLCSVRFFCDVHHIKPRAQGGGHEIENLVVLCPTCHRQAHVGAVTRQVLREMRAAHLRYVKLLQSQQDFLSVVQSAEVGYFIAKHCIYQSWIRSRHARKDTHELFVIAFGFPTPGKLQLIINLDDNAPLTVDAREAGEMSGLEQIVAVPRLIFIEEVERYRGGVPERHYLVRMDVLEEAARLEEALAALRKDPDPDVKKLVAEGRAHRRAVRSVLRSKWPTELQSQHWRRYGPEVSGAPFEGPSKGS